MSDCQRDGVKFRAFVMQTHVTSMRGLADQCSVLRRLVSRHPPVLNNCIYESDWYDLQQIMAWMTESNHESNHDPCFAIPRTVHLYLANANNVHDDAFADFLSTSNEIIAGVAVHLWKHLAMEPPAHEAVSTESQGEPDAWQMVD